ncbi:hypothetical protein ACEWY4_014744 [Coilia grayii]|uniref:Gla domain-containing protein n=1 Tax=Coilia grayii TaxID=363190 RepID=A0ABD1JT59_9TELE
MYLHRNNLVTTQFLFLTLITLPGTLPRSGVNHDCACAQPSFDWVNEIGHTRRRRRVCPTPAGIMGTVFLPQSTAHSVLSRLRRANYFLEEVKQGSIQRECREEICTYEEAREAFENDEKTRRFWEEYVRESSPNKGLESMVGGAQLLYLILPLLLVLVLILAVTITVWKCHARKRSLRSPLAAHSHRDPTLSVVSMDQWGEGFHSDMSPHSELSARSSLGFRSGDAASGRTSAGDPPPSYDEAVGHTDVHIETEPPPQYDDIVTNSSSDTIVGQGK